MRYLFEENGKMFLYLAPLRYHRGVYEGRVENYKGIKEMSRNRRNF